MTRKPLAGIAALFVCTALVTACTVIDVVDPTPSGELTSAIPMSPARPAMTSPVQVASAGVYAPVPTLAPTLAPVPAPNTELYTPAPVTVGFPAMPLPRFGTQSAPQPNVMPADEAQCRQRLKRLGVSFRDIPAIRDSASCGIDWPVEVTSLARNIRLAPAAKLNCAMAEEAARWAQQDLAPAARTRYLSGIAEVRQMSSYSCRKIAGSRSFSEHATGNALDIGAIKLKNGRVIDVQKPGLFAFRERSFLRRVRAEACDHFGTVLGPGYNRDHADHFHIDLKERRNAACH
ncbi:MAG: extensin family protein [Oricola sp.]